MNRCICLRLLLLPCLAFNFDIQFMADEEDTMDRDDATGGNCGNTGDTCLDDSNNSTGGLDTSIDTSIEGKCPSKTFTLKKWNAVAMWSWDVDCDTCAICRVHVMDACLKCQADNKQDECVVVWGDCNHSFHNCCMSLWVQQNNRCPLCQQDWVVQRIGK